MDIPSANIFIQWFDFMRIRCDFPLNGNICVKLKSSLCKNLKGHFILAKLCAPRESVCAYGSVNVNVNVNVVDVDACVCVYVAIHRLCVRGSLCVNNSILFLMIKLITVQPRESERVRCVYLVTVRCVSMDNRNRDSLNRKMPTSNLFNEYAFE